MLAAEAIQTGSERQDSRYDPNGANISRVGNTPVMPTMKSTRSVGLEVLKGRKLTSKNRLGLIRRNDGVVLEWGRDYDVPMNNTSIAGVRIPDSKLAQAATELVRGTESRCIPPVGINV